ncbi:MAG: DUF4286 family protein [Flavobacterium sp.]|nr:MAG: DUF4286 family protein [Flavobacterium sp.]
MIIYNVTINIDESVHEQWFEWMMEKHIPAMMETGKFTKAKIVKPNMREEGVNLFGDKMLAFRTELELIKEFKSI